MSPVRPPAAWPWGDVRAVRERLVEPGDFAQRLKARRPDPRAPRLPTQALLDWGRPARTADTLRLPDAPAPADGPASDWMLLESLVQRWDAQRDEIGGLVRQAPPDRTATLRAELDAERRMIELVRGMLADLRLVRERVAEAQKAEESP